MGKFWRAPKSHFVKRSVTEVPRDFGLPPDLLRIRSLIAEFRDVGQRAFLDDLHENRMLQEPGFQLVVELLLVDIRRRIPVRQIVNAQRYYEIPEPLITGDALREVEFAECAVLVRVSFDRFDRRKNDGVIGTHAGKV